MSALPAASSFDERLVRDYARLRRKAGAIARRSGLSAEEIEEVFQDAWLVCWRRREEIEHVEAFFGQVMRNIVSERLGWKHRHPTVPLEVVRDQGEGEAGPAIEVPDEDAPSPAEAAERRWEGHVAREIVEELSPLGQQLVKLRWGLDVKPREIRARLGLTEKRYEKEFKAAGTHVFDRAARVASGRWCEERRSLLKWYALGHAGGAQRERAEQHLAACPACRAMVREVQGTVRGLAVVLSGPELVAAAGGGGRLPALVDLATSIKQQLADAVLEAKVQASALVARTPGAGSGSSAAATGTAGGFGAAGTVKVATALCVGAGAVGGTAACIEALAPVDGLRGDRAEQNAPKRRERVRVASTSARLGARRRAEEFTLPRRERRPRSRAAQAEPAPSAPSAAEASSLTISPAPSVRPASQARTSSSPPSGGEEFGFEASSPSSSSGGGSSGNSSSEFAPYAGSSSTGSGGSSTGSAGSGSSSGGEFGGP
jgi:RNA polymerase sigma factor (sigma-70 family)